MPTIRIHFSISSVLTIHVPACFRDAHTRIWLYSAHPTRSEPIYSYWGPGIVSDTTVSLVQNMCSLFYFVKVLYIIEYLLRAITVHMHDGRQLRRHAPSHMSAGIEEYIFLASPRCSSNCQSSAHVHTEVQRAMHYIFHF